MSRMCVVCGVSIDHRHGRAKVCGERCAQINKVNYMRRYNREVVAANRGEEERARSRARYHKRPRRVVACVTCGCAIPSECDPRATVCSKACRDTLTNINQKKWREAHPERHRQYAAKWEAANPEKVRERNQRFASNNRDRLRAKAAKYLSENREQIREKLRAARRDHPEHFRELAARSYARNADSRRAQSRNRYHELAAAFRFIKKIKTQGLLETVL